MKKIKFCIKKISDYLFSYRWRLVLLIVLFFLSGYIIQVPYLNILFTFENNIIVFWILVIIILQVNHKVTVAFSMFWIIMAFVSIIRGRIMFSEQMGTIIMGVFFIAFLQKLIEKE